MLNLQYIWISSHLWYYLSTIKFATATIVQYIANKVLAEIGKGETSFAALASQYSTCPSSSRGGSLGSFAPGTMVKEFDEVVFAPNTKVGSILGPVQTQFGYHLICVDKRTGGGDWYWGTKVMQVWHIILCATGAANIPRRATQDSKTFNIDKAVLF